MLTYTEIDPLITNLLMLCQLCTSFLVKMAKMSKSRHMAHAQQARQVIAGQSPARGASGSFAGRRSMIFFHYFPR